MTPADQEYVAMDFSQLPADEQYRLVYNGIAAVASNCDGAISEDGVGFNGQDTKFGKRIASVPFEMWTDDVKVEAARIALTYKQQILAYTGIDMFELPVVKEATGHGTNRQARDDARRFEKIAQRVLVLEANRVVFEFPYNATVKDDVKAAGCRFDPANKSWWSATVTDELKAVAARHGFQAAPDFWDRAEKLLTPAKPAAAKPAVHGYIVNGDVVFDFPYNPAQKDAIKAAGARWNAADKTWRVKVADPKAAAVIAAARQVGLTVAKEVDAALGGAAKAEEVKLDRRTLLLRTSTVSRPAEVDPQFEQLVMAAIGR